MGGTSCKHINVIVTQVYNTEKNTLGLFVKQYADLHCKDCGDDFMVV